MVQGWPKASPAPFPLLAGRALQPTDQPGVRPLPKVSGASKRNAKSTSIPNERPGRRGDWTLRLTYSARCEDMSAYISEFGLQSQLRRHGCHRRSATDFLDDGAHIWRQVLRRHCTLLDYFFFKLHSKTIWLSFFSQYPVVHHTGLLFGQFYTVLPCLWDFVTVAYP